MLRDRVIKLLKQPCCERRLIVACAGRVTARVTARFVRLGRRSAQLTDRLPGGGVEGRGAARSRRTAADRLMVTL